MCNHQQGLLRAFLGLVLSVGAFQLHAQMDPRLQSGNTDFMDLYQQSSSLKPKPEIATIVDCSGSMASLMYHPLYQSMDLSDADDYRYMEFVYHGASGGTAAANTYTITATSPNPPCSTSATYTVTVTSTGATGAFNTPAVACNSAQTTANTITIEAYANGDSSALETLVFTPTGSGTNPSYTITSNTNAGSKSNTSGSYEMTTATAGATTPAPSLIIATAVKGATNYSTAPGTVYPTGTVFTFHAYLTHSFSEGEASSDKLIDWTQSNGGSTPSQSSWTEVTADLLYESVATWTIPNWTLPVVTPTQLNPIVCKVSGVTTNTFNSGNVLNLSDFYASLPSGTTSANLTWTVAANTSNTCTGAPGAITGGNVSGHPTETIATTTGPGGTVNWTVPAFCTNANTNTASAYVTVTLDPRVGSAYTAPGVTYLTAVLSNNTNTLGTGGVGDSNSALRKPDGTAVNAADAQAAATYDPSPTAPSLAYTHLGSADVRNWIRAASHVRFAVTTASGYTRSVDIPIPWKIMDVGTYATTLAANSNQSLNPLPSSTVPDQEIVQTIVAGQIVNTTYGSGLNIEMDQTWKVENATGAILASDANGDALTASTATTAYLYGVVYRPAYISWLFTGTYQNTNAAWPGYTTDSTLYGTAGANFIAYDAVTVSRVPNQSSLSWGQGFGPAGNWCTPTTLLPLIKIPQYSSTGSYLGTQRVDGSTIATPSVTRLQAVKRAAINTWVAHQADVYWALRELDPTNEAGSGTASTINNNSTTTITTATPTPVATATWPHLNGLDSGWTVFNNTSAQGINATTGNSVNAMARLSYLFANNETPLTYALARTLAQFEDPNSVFNAVEGANVSQCVNSYLILFTDGIDNNAEECCNNANATTPYITAGNLTVSGVGGGNEYIIQNPTSIDRSGQYWNLSTIAGIAAHLSDPTLGTVNVDYMPQWAPGTGVTTGVPHVFLPFAINQRGNAANNNLLQYSKDHRVTIMTVGVSLGGTVNSPGGPKQNLFNTAVAGDPDTTANPALPAVFHGFVPPTGTSGSNWVGSDWVANDWVQNPQDPSDYPTIGQRTPGAVYFFDGSNPTALSSAMKYAFAIAIGTPTNNTTASPSLPFVGQALGSEIYLGSFQPPAIGGVIWPGDLMMFSTTSTNGAVNIVTNAGAPATTLNASTAEWSAAASFSGRYWDTVSPPTGMIGRKLYTRLPGTATTPEPGLIPFTYTNTAITSQVLNAANPSLDVQFAMGASTSTANATNNWISTTNRSNIMGDIIDSAPAALEYTWSYVQPNLASYSPALTQYSAGTTKNRFRLILVGDNQGWLHAFGEVTWTVQDPANTSLTLTKGVVDELWAFMPTDFLPYLDYITHPSNTHRYMVDGSPTVYFLDQPAANGGPGNGTVDAGERAIVVFGLGKGGRSYYALNINNPFVPTIQWSLRPDEASVFPASRDLTGSTTTPASTILGKFGFSTCPPNIGRISFNSNLYDAVFLGGGFSVPEVETNFTGAPHLGRSTMAVDVYSGKVLAAQDLTVSNIGGSTIGPVGAGLVPFEFALNTGMAQRAYFLDYTGGLYAWGSKDVTSTAPYLNFRTDSSELAPNLATNYHGWQIRKVFQDDNTAASGKGGRYTTLPAPYRVGTFPGPAYNGQAVPTAVGIAMVSGDRNNPLDRSYTTANPIPLWHQMTMVFDRQDSRALGLDNAPGSPSKDTGVVPGIGGGSPLLIPLSETAITSTPGNPCADPAFKAFTQGCSPDSYFLGTSATPKYGYYVTFPIPMSPAAPASTFLSKGINPPIVVANTLSYDYFTPLTSDPCTGGTGNTYTWFISDVLHPIVNDLRPGMLAPSGGVLPVWSGVASNFMAIGNGVLQAGQVAGAGANGASAAELNNHMVNASSRYPAVKVWRTVQ
jgi:Tfp pilus tip-associated adhesin PilY1